MATTDPTTDFFDDCANLGYCNPCSGPQCVEAHSVRLRRTISGFTTQADFYPGQSPLYQSQTGGWSGFIDGSFVVIPSATVAWNNLNQVPSTTLPENIGLGTTDPNFLTSAALSAPVVYPDVILSVMNHQIDLRSIITGLFTGALLNSKTYVFNDALYAIGLTNDFSAFDGNTLVEFGDSTDISPIYASYALWRNDLDVASPFAPDDFGLYPLIETVQTGVKFKGNYRLDTYLIYAVDLHDPAGLTLVYVFESRVHFPEQTVPSIVFIPVPDITFTPGAAIGRITIFQNYCQ